MEVFPWLTFKAECQLSMPKTNDDLVKQNPSLLCMEHVKMSGRAARVFVSIQVKEKIYTDFEWENTKNELLATPDAPGK